VQNLETRHKSGARHTAGEASPDVWRGPDRSVSGL